MLPAAEREGPGPCLVLWQGAEELCPLGVLTCTGSWGGSLQ